MYQNTIGYRNNNPTNIRYSRSNRWVGQTGSNRGFCVFSSRIYAYRATAKLLRKYVRSMPTATLEKIIRRWAPDNENDTEAYINFVSRHTGIGRTTPIAPDDKQSIIKIITAMVKQEIGWQNPLPTEISQGVDMV